MPQSKVNPDASTPSTDVVQFARGAYVFVQQGLAYTSHKQHGKLKDGDEPGTRHVGGAQLCHGLRDYAIIRYGPLALDVLHHWNIRSTADFGRIVFQLIEKGHMSQSDDDRFEDFLNVYRFDEAFGVDRVAQEVLSRS